MWKKQSSQTHQWIFMWKNNLLKVINEFLPEKTIFFQRIFTLEKTIFSKLSMIFYEKKKQSSQRFNKFWREKNNLLFLLSLCESLLSPLLFCLYIYISLISRSSLFRYPSSLCACLVLCYRICIIISLSLSNIYCFSISLYVVFLNVRKYGQASMKITCLVNIVSYVYIIY